MGIFKWTPLRGMEGDRHWVCFRGEDREGKHALDEVCSVLVVTKCHYCARVGETLKYVAEQYNFDTNWLRLGSRRPFPTRGRSCAPRYRPGHLRQGVAGLHLVGRAYHDWQEGA